MWICNRNFEDQCTLCVSVNAVAKNNEHNAGSHAICNGEKLRQEFNG